MQLIIITGVSRGLGKEILINLLHTNHKIICIGRKFPGIEDKPLKNIIFIKNDFFNEFQSLSPDDLGLDNSINEIIYINNAATIEPISFVGNFKNHEIKNSIRVNFEYPVYLTNNLLSICLKKDIILRIINISTGAANKPFAGWSLYCSTKAATKMFFDCLALETEKILVKHIDPGVMDTNMQEIIRNTADNQFPLRDKFIEYKNKNLLKSPNEVAREILIKEGLL